MLHTPARTRNARLMRPAPGRRVRSSQKCRRDTRVPALRVCATSGRRSQTALLGVSIGRRFVPSDAQVGARGQEFYRQRPGRELAALRRPHRQSALAQSQIGRSPSAGAVSRRSRKRRRGNQRSCAKSRPSSLSFVSRRWRCRYPIVRIFVISPRDASARRSKMTAPCRMAMSRAAAKACRASSMLPRPSASRHSPRRR